MIVIWKKNGLRLRVLGQTIGRFGEDRLLVQKETAQDSHGIFSLSPRDIR
jgi:hypothetical protein